MKPGVTYFRFHQLAHLLKSISRGVKQENNQTAGSSFFWNKSLSFFEIMKPGFNYFAVALPRPSKEITINLDVFT